MPITIQEIIASDTISQLVDKTNFNFDQLLLNGGGPNGPQGPQGPTGPAGGRGEKGSTWYEDTSVVVPGNTPIAVPPTAAPLSGDYYLQFNGDVWEYNGTTWVITTINLEGPTGPAGVTGGFTTYFGQGNVPVNKNTIMVTPTGFGFGATNGNEGIQTVLIGAVGSNAQAVDPTIPLTPQYQLTDTMAGSLASDTVSMIVHQKNSGTVAAIAFMGGAGLTGTNPDDYEQNVITNLSNIQLGIDDTLNIIVPKPATTPISNATITGFNVVTEFRGQNYSAGGRILLTSGTNAAPTGFGGANGNIEIQVKAEGGGGGAGNQLKMTTLGTSGSTQILAGIVGAIPINPGTSTSTGNILIDANGIGLVSKNDEIILNSISSSIELYTNAGTGGIIMLTNTGNIGLQTTGGNITQTSISGDINSSTTTGDMLMSTYQGNIEITSLVGAGSGGNIDIASAPLSGNGNISIYAGGTTATSGYGAVGIRSRQYALTLDATYDADLNIQNNTQTRAKFLGGNNGLSSGRIMLGGGAAPADVGYLTWKGLVVIDSTEVFSGITPTDTIHVGISPTVGVSVGSSQGLGYNGGGEVVGPYAQAANPAFASTAWQVEPNGALHLRSNVKRGTISINPNPNIDETTLPGSIWMYPTTPTQTVMTNAAYTAGEYIDGNTRLWSTPLKGTSNSLVNRQIYGTRGITIGLNAEIESAITPYTNYGAPGLYNAVSGRTFLYGQRAVYSASNNPLDQNIAPISGTSSSMVAGVNVGDEFRGRQSFKVWGDYVGNYYVSEMGGIFSGASAAAAVEQQVFLSGGQSFSPWADNLGSNTTGASIPKFKYKYQWQRVGRVVTGSGMIRQKVITQVSPLIEHEIDIDEYIEYGGAQGSLLNNYEVVIGPMPWPVQVANANTTDSLTTPSAQRGVDNLNISGVTSGAMNYTGSTVATWGLDQTGSGLTLPVGPAGVGVVGGGSATAISSMDTGGTATHMWLKVYPVISAADSGGSNGYIPGYIKFTFSYEVNP